MAQCARRGPVDVAVAALVSLAVVMTIVGCAAEALTPFDYGDEAAVRLTGGSIPGGQKVCGYALGPYDGVSARDTGEQLWELADAAVTIQGPSGCRLTDRTETGFFDFEEPESGPSTLSFDLDGDGIDTQVAINVWTTESIGTRVVAGVLPAGASTVKKHTRVEAKATTTKLTVGDPQARAVLSATVDGLGTATADLVWVMETMTDARLLPFEVADDVFLTSKAVVAPGQVVGDAVVWAQVPGAQSGKLIIRVVNR